jgi:hypothetical protein
VSDVAASAERFYARYRYPDWLREHSRVVGTIGAVLARARVAAGEAIDVETVTLAAYLHDIGRSPLLAGDPREHNELSALILAAEGLDGCVEPARRHAIYTVLEPATAPRTMDEKLVYIADRRGGMGVETLGRARRTPRAGIRASGEIERAVPSRGDRTRCSQASPRARQPRRTSDGGEPMTVDQAQRRIDNRAIGGGGTSANAAALAEEERDASRDVWCAGPSASIRRGAA